MAQVSKITMSVAEMEAMNNSEFFLLKHTAIQKVIAIFGDLERQIKEDIHRYPFLKDHSNIAIGKIFRGENYGKLPYVVLDYPKRFSSESIFTFRTMFWWGNEFSFTLHLQGEALNHFRKKVLKKIHLLIGKDIFFCVGDNPWDYHFKNDNYRVLDELLTEGAALSQAIHSKEFIKLSRKLPLDKYESVVEYGVETFELFMSMLDK